MSHSASSLPCDAGQASAGPPLVAVDVGNTRSKFALFLGAASAGLPRPEGTLDLAPQDDLARVADWLAPLAPVASRWWIGSVNRPASSRLVAWLRQRPDPPAITLLSAGDLPLRVDVPRPDMVGIDRLLGAVAANRLRPAGYAAVVVDAGTAITVDRVRADGAFAGGAILPGIALSARALHEYTDLLPHVGMSSLGDPPPPLGTSTVEALRSGLFWGAVGGIRELVGRLSGGEPTSVFVTGGAAPAVATLLGAGAVYDPHLVCAGIAVAAGRGG